MLLVCVYPSINGDDYSKTVLPSRQTSTNPKNKNKHFPPWRPSDSQKPNYPKCKGTITLRLITTFFSSKRSRAPTWTQLPLHLLSASNTTLFPAHSTSPPTPQTILPTALQPPSSNNNNKHRSKSQPLGSYHSLTIITNERSDWMCRITDAQEKKAIIAT